MFAVYIITMGLSLCTAVLAVCTYKIADHVEKLKNEPEKMKRRRDERKLIELKPCPFCGGEAELKEGNVYLDRCIRARCKKGCVSTKPVLIDHPRITFDGLDESTRYTEEQAKQEAAKIWNRRADDEQRKAD